MVVKSEAELVQVKYEDGLGVEGATGAVKAPTTAKPRPMKKRRATKPEKGADPDLKRPRPADDADADAGPYPTYRFPLAEHCHEARDRLAELVRACVGARVCACVCGCVGV